MAKLSRHRRSPRRAPIPVELPMTQGAWEEPERRVLSPILLLALVIFAGALIWALLPSPKPEPAPTAAQPASRDLVPPARQAAPALQGQPPAPPAPSGKPIARADAGARRHKSAAKQPTAPVAQRAEPSVKPAATAAPRMVAPLTKPAAEPAKARPLWKVKAWRAEGQSAELLVFGPRNKKVAHLKSEPGAAGWVELAWDGKDEAGSKVATGLYYLRPSWKDSQIVEEAWVP